MTSVHPFVTGDELHTPFRSVWADAASRSSDAGPYDAAESVAGGGSRIAIGLQLDTAQQYYLQNHSPVQWVAFPGGGGGGGYSTIQNGGTPLTQRSTLNVSGALISAADDAGNSRTVLSSVGFGSSSGTVTQGDDSRIPSQDENDALQGTSGSPSGSNRYLTDSDPRNTNARTPTAHVHAASDVTSGSFADARISQSSVVQHQAALAIAQSQVSGVRQQKHITVESPSAAENITWFFTQRALTLTAIRAVIRQQAGGASVTWSVRFGADRSAAGTEVVTGGTATTNNTTGQNVTTFSNGSIPANRYVWVTTSASTQVASLNLSLFATES